MISKKILIPIVIVLLIGVAAASYHVTTTTPRIWQPSVSQAQTSFNHGSSSSSSRSAISGTQSISSPKNGSGEADVKILPSEAKNIVQQNVLVPGFKVGTPDLTTLDSKIVYYVPILNGTTQAGEMYVDAQTGDILEGAGGVGNGSNG